MKLNQIIHELHRKYDRTFIFVEVEGREVLAHVQSLEVVGEGDKASGEIQLNTAAYGILKYKIPTTQKLIFRLPRAQTYQDGNKACLVSRIPARQWARGMSTTNSSIIDLSRYVVHGCVQSAANAVSYTLPNVAASFNGESYSAQQALDMLASGKFSSVAIRGNWALALSPTKAADGYVLLHKYVMVGRISREGQVMRVTQPVYEQAMRQLFGGTVA